MIYKLTKKGRDLKWSDWKRRGGCGLSHQTQVQVTLQLGVPLARWDNYTLGQLVDAHVVAGREMGRYAFSEEEEGVRQFYGLSEEVGAGGEQ